MSPSLRATPLALGLLVLAPPGASAQQIVVVDVREAGTGRAVQDARIEFVDAPETLPGSALTDLSGRATFLEADAGVWTLRVTAFEYENRELRVQVLPDTTTFVSVEMVASAIALDPLDVSVEGLDPLLLDVGFYEREAGNRGYYYGPERIERIAGRVRLSTMLRYMSPLRASRTSNGRSVIFIKRGYDRCFPTLYLDGVRVRGFDVDDVVDPNDVVGVEIYDMPNLIPIEFRRTGVERCVVLFWTRRR